MSTNKLYRFYIDLIPNLVVDLIFYIPENEILGEIQKELNTLNFNKTFKRVFVLDEFKGPVEIDSQSNKTYTLLLDKNLEKNIFSLIEKREKLSESGFNFILKKYFVLVEALYSYTKWMNDHHAILAEKNENLSKRFYNQYQSIKKHLETLVSTFFKSKNSIPAKLFDTQLILDELLPDLVRSFPKSKVTGLVSDDKKIQARTNLGDSSEAKKVETTTPVFKISKRKVLISEAEAEKVLLQTYFGINKN